MTGAPFEADKWITPFDHVLVVLDSTGLIRHVWGASDAVLAVSAAQLEGMTWHDFVEEYAAETTHRGLHYAWLALTRQHVSPDHWPAYLPFAPSIGACLKLVRDSPEDTVAVHLAPSNLPRLERLLGQQLLDVLLRLERLSQHVFRGTDGPLTDLQVRTIGGLSHGADWAQQLLENVRAELLLPAVEAPLPQSIGEMFGFSERDFAAHRLTTHRLHIVTELPAMTVYCQPSLRGVVRRIVQHLITQVEAQSTILLAFGDSDNPAVVRVEVHFCSEDADLQITTRVQPLATSDMKYEQPLPAVQSFVTVLQAYLRSVNGRAWAESSSKPGMTGRIVLDLPRWIDAPGA
ncbi:MAG: hypothetical protein JW966_14550 [Anaerolineae bacterium]|nr:hypothetical protein [Anaerolineae bacterium]